MGFDYDGARVVLKDLATFHAVPIALKLKKRQVFEDKIKKNTIRPEFKPPEPKEGDKPHGPPGAENEVWFEILESYDQCKLYVPKIRQFMEDMKEQGISFWELKDKREPFATLSHNDMWGNNTMQIIMKQKLLKNKFVDFQGYSYDSPARDLLFFLFSSVQLGVLKQHFDDLIEFYYENFLGVLVELGCDSSPFSHEKFQVELKATAPHELFHAIMMARVIYGKKGEFAMDLNANPQDHVLTKNDLNDMMIDRAVYILQCCGRRGWI